MYFPTCAYGLYTVVVRTDVNNLCDFLELRVKQYDPQIATRRPHATGLHLRVEDRRTKESLCVKGGLPREDHHSIGLSHCFYPYEQKKGTLRQTGIQPLFDWTPVPLRLWGTATGFGFASDQVGPFNHATRCSDDHLATQCTRHVSPANRTLLGSLSKGTGFNRVHIYRTVPT